MYIIFLLTLVIAQPPQKPVIGILTQDTDDPYSTGQYSTYIAASYVQYMQGAGALVVPIFYHSTKAELDYLLPRLNGVLFPGGGMLIDVNHPWTYNTKYILEYANAQNIAGNPYPIWSTCLGFQTLMFLTTDSDDKFRILSRVEGQQGVVSPQIVYDNDSILLRSLTPQQYEAFTTGTGTVFYHHHWSVNIKTYNQQLTMNSFWKLITTSKTKDGSQFVSTVEARHFPYFGTQYHPEKNSYEWRVPALKTSTAITTSHHLVSNFIAVARANKNTFPPNQLAKRVIYNYQPTLTGLDYQFVQIYIFDQSKQLSASNDISINIII